MKKNAFAASAADRVGRREPEGTRDLLLSDPLEALSAVRVRERPRLW
jgi:hypothetical protein